MIDINNWLLEVYSCWSAYTTLNTLQSFSHIPHMHKANLTTVPSMIQWCLISRGGAQGSGVYQSLHHCQGLFCELYLIFLTTPELIAKKFPVMILLLSCWLQPRSCNSGSCKILKIAILGICNSERGWGLWNFICAFSFSGFLASTGKS